MEQYQSKSKWLMIWIFTAFAVSSVSIACIPLTENFPEEISTVAAYVIGALFWIGLISGIVLSGYTKSALSKPRKYFQSHHTLPRQRHSGMLSFDFTVHKIILYVVCALGLILFLCDFIFRLFPEIVMFPIIAITIFAIEFHGIVDGINYKTYKLLKEGIKDEN